MAIVVYNGANQHSISAGPDHRVVLNPGQNIVDDEVWDKIYNHAQKERDNKRSKTRGGVLYLEDEGMLEVITLNDDEFDISATPKKKAIEIINSEIDLGVLKSYQDAENAGKSRKGVLEALTAQIHLIEQANSGDGSGSGDAD